MAKFMNPPPSSFHASVDPISLILSQKPMSDTPTFLNLTSESFFVLERGPRYGAYAKLRETRIRMRNKHIEEQETPPLHESRLTPPKKIAKFQGNLPLPERRRAAAGSAVAQSVPDFSAMLRKENRKPVEANVKRLPPVLDRTLTPPAKRSSMLPGSIASAAKSGGSKSASAVEKRRVGVMTRRSYAGGAEELKGLASAAQAAMRTENRGSVRSGRGAVVRSILGNRQF